MNVLPFYIETEKNQYYVCVALCLWGCRHYSDKDLKEIICEETVLNYKYNNSDLAISTSKISSGM